MFDEGIGESKHKRNQTGLHMERCHNKVDLMKKGLLKLGSFLPTYAMRFRFQRLESQKAPSWNCQDSLQSHQLRPQKH